MDLATRAEFENIKREILAAATAFHCDEERHVQSALVLAASLWTRNIHDIAELLGVESFDIKPIYDNFASSPLWLKECVLIPNLDEYGAFALMTAATVGTGEFKAYFQFDQDHKPEIVFKSTADWNIGEDDEDWEEEDAEV